MARVGAIHMAQITDGEELILKIVKIVRCYIFRYKISGNIANAGIQEAICQFSRLCKGVKRKNVGPIVENVFENS